MDIVLALTITAGLVGYGLAIAVGLVVRRSLVRWLFVAGMVLLATECLFYLCSVEIGSLAHLFDRLELLSMSFAPGIWFVFSLYYARGDSRRLSAKCRWAMAAASLAPVVWALWFWDRLVSSSAGRAEVLGIDSPGVILNVLLLIGAVLVLTNVERTFSTARGMTRWRIKYMLLGLGVLFVARAYTNSQVLLFHAFRPSLQAVNALALLAASALMVRSLLRVGHFEVNVYPSRFVLHHSLTALISGIYLLILGIFAKWVTLRGGDSEFALKAFVVLVLIVLLAIGLLSDRVRLSIHRFISRNFHRPAHDYRLVWRNCTEAMASCVDQPRLCQATVRLLADVFHALSVTLWTLDDKKEKLKFAASTVITGDEGGRLALQEEVAQALDALQNSSEPINIDQAEENWAEILRRLHPHQFPQGVDRFCVPIRANGDLVGLLTIGDRVAKAPFSLQDQDLLKSIADQLGASLLNVRLSERLQEAKELEAFQTMSTFFIHDLKNTASMLGLMLQNMPAHFENPEFRADALRGVAQSASHINDLVRRLGQLRHKLELRPAESDLNEIVSNAFAGLQASGFTLMKDLRPLPKLHLDTKLMGDVVNNLLLNAVQAVRPDGQIHIKTDLRPHWAVLTIVDNGCGMSSDFVSRLLFRPFQTTKKNGLGIGMFQSKMIVEAHRGRIEVESQIDKGTTCQVFLPLRPIKTA